MKTELTHLTHLGGFELAEKIKNKEVTSFKIVSAHIERAKFVNPRLNAIVEDRYNSALEEARMADAAIAKSEVDFSKSPLFGVPFTMKEMMAVEGFHSTNGSIHLKDRVQEKNATVTQRMLDAGGILLGTTNVPEVGLWFECDNVIYGRTSNPYDLSRTAGGSSGGESAIIASGASPMGVGSDVGGSIRMPAGFCGIFGHKASNKIIPMTGHDPLQFENAQDIVGSKYPVTVIGPMSRRATDLYPMMKLLIGPDDYDKEVRTDFELAPPVESWKGRKVFLLSDPKISGTLFVGASLKKASISAAKVFEKLGAEIIELDSDIFKRATKYWFARMATVEKPPFSEKASQGEGIEYFKEVFNSLKKKRRYTAPILIMAMLEDYLFGSSNHDSMFAELCELEQSLTAKLGDSGILIMPGHSRLAPKHGSTLMTPFDFAYTGIFNALCYPATAMPAGYTQQGLPVGIQIAAAPGQDHLCISAAVEIERHLGGWDPSSLVV